MLHLGVDFVEDEVVAGLDRCAEISVEHADGKSSDGEQGDDPDVGLADVGGVSERDEQDSGGGAGHNSDEGGDGDPSKKFDKDAEGVRGDWLVANLVRNCGLGGLGWDG